LYAGQRQEITMESYVYGEKKALPVDFTEYFDPAVTAIVSIDMHEGHLADTPDCPCPGPRAREVVEPMNAFHREARKFGVPVIHVRSVCRTGGVDDIKGLKAAWRLTMPLYFGPIPNIDQHALEGSRWNNFVTEIVEGDLIVSTKRRLSAWYATDLDFLLRNLRARTIVINGTFTDCCVLNAAFEGSNLGYHVVVPRDLVAGSNPDMEDAALKIMSLYTGVVVDSTALLRSWSQTGEKLKAVA
jgi:nicotinamidase-related amidase